MGEGPRGSHTQPHLDAQHQLGRLITIRAASTCSAPAHWPQRTSDLLALQVAGRNIHRRALEPSTGKVYSELHSTWLWALESSGSATRFSPKGRYTAQVSFPATHKVAFSAGHTHQLISPSPHGVESAVSSSYKWGN